MKSILYINFYVDKNPDRQKELEICLKNNLEAGFDIVYLLVEQRDEEYIGNIIRNSSRKQDVIVATCDSRPTFQDYFSLFDTNPDVLNCWCNADIFITSQELSKLKELPWERNLGVCLSRHDLGPEGAFLLERGDSADFWAVKGPCRIKDFCCTHGPGVDNSLAWKLNESGYYVINPSRSIQVMHLHNVKINNYRNEIGDVIANTICPEPYFFHLPIKISEI